MDFCTIDFETANRNRASACQVGIALYSGGLVVSKWKSLINPESDFEWRNTKIHGISLKDVLDSPTFPQIVVKIKEITSIYPVFHKSNFDREVYVRSLERYGIELNELNWFDATDIAKSTWVGLVDYSLTGICDHLSYTYGAHDALEDALALGHIVHEALKINGSIDISSLNKSKYKRNSLVKRERIDIQSSVSGPLSGSTFLFSEVSDKRLLANMAEKKGGHTIDYWASKVTHLVVGELLSVGRIAKTTKMKKAEDAKLNGSNVQIMSEMDYIKYISSF